MVWLRHTAADEYDDAFEGVYDLSIQKIGSKEVLGRRMNKVTAALRGRKYKSLNTFELQDMSRNSSGSLETSASRGSSDFDGGSFTPVVAHPNACHVRDPCI